MPYRRAVALLVTFAAVLTAGLIWLAFDNPTIGGTSRGRYTCLAPWDTVLNGADNVIGRTNARGRSGR